MSTIGIAKNFDGGRGGGPKDRNWKRQTQWRENVFFTDGNGDKSSKYYVRLD